MRSFLSNRIKLAREQRDRLLKATNMPLLKSVDSVSLFPTDKEQLAARAAVVDELTRVANFLDFTSTNISDTMDDKAKWRVIVNQFFSAFDKWFEENNTDWSKVDETWLTGVTEMLEKPDIHSQDKITFLGLATMIKRWHESK